MMEFLCSQPRGLSKLLWPLKAFLLMVACVAVPWPHKNETNHRSLLKEKNMKYK
jgi:hypothetical protein